MEVCLKRGEELDIANGSLWIYDNEIDWYTDTCVDGGVVDVLDSRRRFVARGFFNARSKIVVRVLTRDREEQIDREFFRRRIESAWNYRRAIGLTNACRVVFGDSDGLPGLTVDKFGDYLSFQIVSLGLENFKQDILEILVELLHPLGIYERNDLQVREKEGLPQRSAGSVLLHRRIFRPCRALRGQPGGRGGRVGKRAGAGAAECGAERRGLREYPLRQRLRRGA